MSRGAADARERARRRFGSSRPGAPAPPPCRPAFIPAKVFDMTDGFSAIQVADGVYWVGAIDWTIRNFHGYQTSRGTTYSAYLVCGERPTLIDTVKAPFRAEMMARIASVMEIGRAHV